MAIDNEFFTTIQLDISTNELIDINSKCSFNTKTPSNCDSYSFYKTLLLCYCKIKVVFPLLKWVLYKLWFMLCVIWLPLLTHLCLWTLTQYYYIYCTPPGFMGYIQSIFMAGTPYFSLIM